MPIFTTATDGPYAALAADVAADRDDDLVSNVSEIGRTDPVRYVAPPDQISSDVLYRLVKDRMDAGTGAVNVALITGRTPAEARALYERSTESASVTETGTGTGTATATHHHVLLPDTDRAVTPAGSDASVRTGDDVTVASVCDIDDAASVSAVLHGKNPYARLADGLLIGYPDSPDAFDFPSPQPPFVLNTDSSGTPDIDVPSPSVRAERVTASQVFLNSCSSLLSGTNRGSDHPVHVALSLLSQAQTMIGTYRVTECIPFHGMLHHNLLQTGYPPAERAYLLNRAAATAGLESYPYLIAGDPWVSPSSCSSPPDPDPHTHTSTYDFEWTTASDTQRGTLKLFDATTPVIDLTVSSPDTRPAESGTHPYFLRLVDGQPADPLFYTAFREGEDVRILISAWGTVDADTLEFTVQSTRSVDDPGLTDIAARELDTSLPLEDIPASVSEAERRAWAGPVNGSARSHLEEARFELRDSNNSLTSERTDPTAYTTTLAALNRTAEALGHAREAVSEEVLRGTDRLSLQDEYRNWTDATGGAALPGHCPYCGRTVHVATREDQFSPVARHLGRCPNCAYVWDVPADDGPTAVPELHGDFTGATGEQIPVTISFRNPLDRPIDAKVVLTITDETVADGTALPEPTGQLSLAPNEHGQVQLPLDLAALRASVTVDSPRGVSVDPDPSYFGPTFRESREQAAAALETTIATDPSVLEDTVVPITVMGERYDVPTESFDVEITERSSARTVEGLDSFYTVEADVILRNLAVYSGIRTLYPEF